MRPETRRFVLLLGLTWAVPLARAQTPHQSTAAPIPTTPSEVGAWDLAIVKRAEALLASPARWNRSDTGDCPGDARQFSILCALQTATEQSAGLYGAARRAPVVGEPSPVECVLHTSGSAREGSCGWSFGELPILSISPARSVTSGAWRADVQPVAVWPGTMAGADYPVLREARRLVDVVATTTYSSRLIGYNNDSTTTFAKLQAFFTALEARVAKQSAADLAAGADTVEIEIYRKGSGDIRTFAGWYPVTGFSLRGSALRFRVDTARQVPPSDLDRRILERAAAILAADSVWNRADDRKCPAAAMTWSIYCAEERAMIEVAGGFHHRRPAMELVRQVIDERARGKSYPHRLMGYNNDPSTTLADVHSLFAEAIARIR